METEWDPQKAALNERKHGVTFVEAETVFDDPPSVTVSDPNHSEDEDRFVIVGASKRNRLLLVAFAERNERIRIISARKLTPAERKKYEEES